MKPFLNEEWFLNSLNCKSKLLKQIEKEIPEKFIENREKGENEDEICKIIQNDSIDEFISFVNKTDYPLTSEVPESIYETNLLLIEKRASLIEYATFFGSVQIFKYLYTMKMNNFTTYFKDFEDKMIMKDLTPLEYAKRNSHSEEIINLLSQKDTK